MQSLYTCKLQPCLSAPMPSLQVLLPALLGRYCVIHATHSVWIYQPWHLNSPSPGCGKVSWYVTIEKMGSQGSELPPGGSPDAGLMQAE